MKVKATNYTGPCKSELIFHSHTGSAASMHPQMRPNMLSSLHSDPFFSENLVFKK